MPFKMHCSFTSENLFCKLTAFPLHFFIEFSFDKAPEIVYKLKEKTHLTHHSSTSILNNLSNCTSNKIIVHASLSDCSIFYCYDEIDKYGEVIGRTLGDHDLNLDHRCSVIY